MGLLDIKEIKVDFTSDNVITIKCSQFDKDSRTFKVWFYDSNVPRLLSTDEKVRIKLMKPDKQPVFDDCTTNSDGSATFTLSEQMCAVYGKSHFQFIVTNANQGKIVNTTPMVLEIVKGVFSNDTVTSSPEFNALNYVLLQCEKIEGLDNATKALDKKVTALSDNITNLSTMYVLNDTFENAYITTSEIDELLV